MAQLANCPSCRRELRVPDALVGQAVRCPDCATIFTTTADGSLGTVVSPPSPPPKETPTGANGGSREQEHHSPSSQALESPDSSDPMVEFDRPRRRYRRRDVEPHRGTTILVLGILALVVAPIILGPIAWILGNADMKKIRAGTMDPEGEGNTNAGRICGIIGTIYGLVSGLCCILGLVMWMIGMAATVRNMPPPAPAPGPIPRPAPPPPRQPNFPRPQRPPIEDDEFDESLSRLLSAPLSGSRSTS